MILRVSIPNPEYVAKGVLASVIRGVGLSFYKKPLEVSVENFDQNFEYLSDWVGRPTLTSLSMKVGGDQEIILTECILTVTQERNIVTTALQGRSGTIKEYISDGDYEIEVMAALQPALEGESFVPPDRYPLDELTAFIKLLQGQDSVDVQSDFLDMFGISSAVVKSYKMDQQTHSNRQTFSITLLSDSPYEIKIKEDVKA